MRDSWLIPQWRGRERIAHPVRWARLPELDVGVALVQTKAVHGHENRWYLYSRKFNEADVQALPVLAQTIITSSPGTTQTITSDATWNNSANSVECIGAGARGAHGSGTSASGGGGGGGAYTRMDNQSITTPGTTQFFARVGGTTATDGTAGGDSWWTLTSPGTSFPVTGTAVGAKGAAALAGATSATGGAGGASSSSYPLSPTVKNDGGSGGSASGLGNAGGGGGGAGGAAGAGGSAATGPSAGGAGNNNSSGGGTGGGAGSPGVAGGAGTNMGTSPNVGSGGGGGGGNASPSTGGAGGLYGGGGGGGGRSTGVGGQGAQGVVVLTWTPIFSGTIAATEVADTAAFPGGKVAWNATLAAQEGNVYELLLHFDGANASTTIVDSGGKNQTVTAHGGAQIDTSQPVFSNSALTLPASGDYLDFAFTPDFVFGNGDFTIDFWTRLSSSGTAQTFFDGGPNGFKIFYDGASLNFTSAAGTISGGIMPSNSNHHIAVTRASGSTRLFRAGVQRGSTLSDATVYSTSAGYPQIGDGVAVTTGTMAATEASDTSALTATVRWNAALAATEASDTAAFTGSLTISYANSETTAWVAAVGAGNVDSNHGGYVDTLISGLKTDGIWTKLDRLWILAAQNSNSALVDLKAQDVATAVNSPTFTADRGYAGNGSTSYIDTTFNASTQAVQFTLNDAHQAVWSNTSRGPATTTAIGVYDGSAVTDLFPYQNVFTATGVGNRVNLAAADPASIAYTSSLGCFIGQSISPTTEEVYVNGTSLGTHAKTYGGYLVNFSFFICAENAGGSPGTASTDQICMASWGATLTSTQAANYYSRLRTYMTSVGVP